MRFHSHPSLSHHDIAGIDGSAGASVTRKAFAASLDKPRRARESLRMVADEASSPRTRLVELDALRGIAAVSVVLYHFTQAADRMLGAGMPTWTRHPLTAWAWPFAVGEHGVALFFVISGFVILMSIERAQNVRDFAALRVARLFPAYIVAVLFTATLRSRLIAAPFTWSQIAANLTMMPSLFGQPYVDGVYWTLEVELRFYFMMALALRWRVVREHLEKFCVAWILFAVALKLLERLPVATGVCALLSSALISPHSMLFSAGIVFYRIHRQGVSRWRLAVLVLSMLATLASGNHLKAAVVAAAFAAFGLVLRGQARMLARSATLRFLGAISYTLYLAHLGVGTAVMQYLDRYSHNLAFLLAPPAVLSFLLALAIHYGAEEPGGRTIRRWYQRLPSAQTVGAATGRVQAE